MCGFIAIYRTAPSFSIDRELLSKGLEAISHRGPDEKNIWFEPNSRAALGHTRLSIMGLDNGQQPICNASGDIQLVVNGEFYDYERIREQLKAIGYKFTTNSDSEIALHLYREYGVEGLKQLRGEFALVLYDRYQNTMLLMRDRMGIKPLFYAAHEGAIYVGSEIKSLLAAGVPAVWDSESYAGRAFYLRDRTLFEGINSVAPGHMAFITSGGIKHCCYWDIDYKDKASLANDKRSESDIIKQVEETVSESVTLRLRSDVPMAFYLSGGIDSSAMLGLASHLSGISYDAFNLSFSDMEDYDENRYAKIAAEKSNANFHTIEVSQADLADNFTTALWHNETPFFNAHGVAKFMLSRAVKKAGFKAVITGEGADEVFAGYPHFRRDVILYNNQGQDPAVVADLAARLDTAKGGYTTVKGVPDIAWLVKQLGHGVSWIDNQASWAKQLSDLYKRDFSISYQHISPYRQFYDQLDHRKLSNLDPLHRSMYMWAKSFLPNFVLTTLGDRMEMAHSIEGRVPLLDHKVVELAATLPVTMKVRGNTEKYVFREAMKPYVPAALYQRKKHYFRAPPSTLMKNGKLFELVQDTLRGNSLADLPFFDPRKIVDLLEKLPTLPTQKQALLDPVLMEITSLCIMQEQFGMTARQNSQEEAA